jgi:A/G-specific adenine glycosylase
MTDIISHQTDISRTFREAGLTGEVISEFRRVIYGYYDSEGRDLPWRRRSDPYAILVSEIMLQQTQVERVLLKYEPFLERFPGWSDLARASLGEILLAWQGLGYNRRAKALQGIAQRVMAAYEGRLPADRGVLESFPGIGAATSGALLAFAFEQPVVFLETNIRRVYLHFFYPEAVAVPDGWLLPLVLLTLDAGNVRKWYYALMDYGAGLKKLIPNPNRRSAHYTRQAPFKGSDREIRSRILQLFLQTPELPEETIVEALAGDSIRIKKILRQLRQENFLRYRSGRYWLATGLESSR